MRLPGDEGFCYIQMIHMACISTEKTLQSSSVDNKGLTLAMPVTCGSS